MPIQNRSRPRAGMAFGGRRSTPELAPRSSTGAFFDGVLDSLSLGLTDQAKAGGGALYDALHGKSGMDAYWRRIAEQHELDRLDAEHGTARTWGKGVGTAAQLLTSGPLGWAARGGARMAEVTPLALRQLGVLGGAGAAGGVATRAGADHLTHHRSSWGGLVASGIGGGVEALLSRSGLPGRAGAVGGATTSITEDILSGRVPSIPQAFEAAGQGGFVGSRLGNVGRKFADGLPKSARQAFLSKENLGEWGSLARTIARGDWTRTRAKTIERLIGGGHTFPDQRTVRGILVESKFGSKNRLRPRQKQAANQFGPNYRIDHMLPDDIGSLAAYPALQLDYSWAGDQNSALNPQR